MWLVATAESCLRKDLRKNLITDISAVSVVCWTQFSSHRYFEGMENKMQNPPQIAVWNPQCNSMLSSRTSCRLLNCCSHQLHVFWCSDGSASAVCISLSVLQVSSSCRTQDRIVFEFGTALLHELLKKFRRRSQIGSFQNTPDPNHLAMGPRTSVCHRHRHHHSRS